MYAKKFRLLVFIIAPILVLFLFASKSDAATITWIGEGADTNWSTTGNWSAGAAPTSTDIAQFSASSTKSVTINQNIDVAGISITAGYTTGTISQGTSTVTVGSSGFTMASGTWDGGTGNWTITDGSFSLSGGAFNAPTATISVQRNITLSGGTFVGNGTTSVTANDVSDDSTLTCSGTFGGIFYINKTGPNGAATFTLSSGCTINLGNNATQTGSRGTITNNGTINSSGTLTFAFDSTGTGSQDFVNNGIFAGNTLDIDDGSFTNSSGATTTFTSSSINVERNFKNYGSFDLAGKTLTLDGSGADSSTLDCGGGTISGNLTIEKSTTNTGTTTIATTGCTIVGTFTRTLGPLESTSTATLTLLGNFSATGTSPLATTSLTLVFASSGNQYASSTGIPWGGPIRINTSSTGELILSSNFNTSSTCTVNGVFNLSGRSFTCGGTFAISSGGTLKLQGGETVTAPTLNTSSTVFFTGNGNGSATNYTITNLASDFYNLTVSSTDGTADTFMLGATTSVSGDFNLSAGTLDASSTGNFGLSVFGSWTALSTSTFQPRSGTVTLGATSTKTLTSGGKQFNNLTLNATSATINLGDALSVSSTLTISTGTLDVSGSNYGISAGGFVNTGSLNARAGTLTIIAQSGSPTLTPGSTLSNLTINATGTTVTLGGALTASGTITFTTGTLDVSGTNYGITIAGNWTNNAGPGGFTARSGTATFNTTGTSTITGTSTFNNFTAATAGKPLVFGAGQTFTISGTWTLTGSSGNTISLRSNSSGSEWRVNPGTASLTFVDTKDSNNIGSAVTCLTSSGCVDSGNNTNWTFVAVATASTGGGGGTSNNPPSPSSAGTFSVTIYNEKSRETNQAPPVETTSTQVFLFFVGGNDSYFVDFGENSLFIPGSYIRGLHGMDKLHPYGFLSSTPGTKTVYARFFTSSLGTPSPVFSDSIILASTTPTRTEENPTAAASTTPQTTPKPPIPEITHIAPRSIPEGFLFKIPLFFGETNDDAAYLQLFLAKDPSLYPEGLITGYFGALTKEAVRRFQCKHDILCDSNDIAHGYVGPKTREKLNEFLLAGTVTEEATLSAPSTPTSPLEGLGTSRPSLSPEELKAIEENIRALQSQLADILSKLVEMLKEKR